MRVQLRIVAGTLRGRKITCQVGPGVRPTPQMVREALFSILGNAVPGRRFLDIFAGTGIVGLEALSRGAAEVVLVERDFRQIHEIETHIRELGVRDQVHLCRADAYRWAERWTAPDEPVTIFISPPFVDFQHKLQELLLLIADLQHKAAPASVIVLQSEEKFDSGKLPRPGTWDERHYGRNELLIWVKEGLE
ncbi:MAG: RsmD family RNA methyltransferase [Gemmataceae bacterium]